MGHEMKITFPIIVGADGLVPALGFPLPTTDCEKEYDQTKN
jgi:hypothetical protein